MKKANEIKVSTKWMTTDAEERELRVERALSEPMQVKPLEKSRKELFQSYEVRKLDDDDAVAYTVELRSLDKSINTCTCPDFRKSGLGTCKHVERVLNRYIRKTRKGESRTSPYIELFMSCDPCEPLLLRGSQLLPRKVIRRFQRYTDVQGRLRGEREKSLAALIAFCDELSAAGQYVARVSSEIRAYLLKLEEQHQLSEYEGYYREELTRSKGALPFLKMPLYPYQFDGVLHLAFKGRAMLADEMGLGKTVQAVAAAAVMREVMGVKRVLVISPASLKAEWEDQIEAFTDLPREVLFGTHLYRLRRYRNTKAFFLLANYEQVMRDFKKINEIYQPELVILDEAQRIKNWRTKTARALKQLDSRFAFILTGTPIENKIDELYSLADFIDPTLFGSLFRFNRKYYRMEEGKVQGMQNLDELHDTASRIMLRRRKDQISDQLPERVDNTYFVKMTPEQRESYSEYENIVARLWHLSKRRPLRPEEMERLQLSLACMRMCCDTCYILDQTIKDAPKIDELEKVLGDIWDDDPTRKIIIFSEWVRMLDLVIERLDEMDVGYAVHTGSIPQKQRRDEIRRFKKDPECRIFLSSESGGVGLNLQSASVVLNLDLPWNPAKLEQRIARAWRKHQKNKVNVINLVSEQTIEHKMLGTLKFKQGLADYVLDARGESADFEKKDAKGAFMARLAEVMDSPVHVASEASNKKRAPVGDRMKSVLSKEGMAVDRCDLIEGEDGKPDAVLAVGNKVPIKKMRDLVQESRGVSLPSSRVVSISPAELELLKKLEGLGFITINSEKRKTVFEKKETAPPAPSKEFLKRCSRVETQNQSAERDLRMAVVLLSGDFPGEALAAARKAVCSAAGGIYLLQPEVEPDAEIASLTDDMVAVLKKNTSIDRSQVAVVQSAFFELEVDAAQFANSAMEFAAYCVQQLEIRRLRLF